MAPSEYPKHQDVIIYLNEIYLALAVQHTEFDEAAMGKLLTPGNFRVWDVVMRPYLDQCQHCKGELPIIDKYIDALKAGDVALAVSMTGDVVKVVDSWGDCPNYSR